MKSTWEVWSVTRGEVRHEDFKMVDVDDGPLGAAKKYIGQRELEMNELRVASGGEEIVKVTKAGGDSQDPIYIIKVKGAPRPNYESEYVEGYIHDVTSFSGSNSA